MRKEILIEGRFVDPTSVKIGEEFDFYLETRNPAVSLCKSKKKYLKHLHDNLYSLCGEIKKIRTGGMHFSAGVNTQMIVDCSLPVLISLNFGRGFENSFDFENYKKIPGILKIPFRAFRGIYYFLIDTYKIDGSISFPIFIQDSSRIRLKFLREGDYIETQCKLFSFLDGGWEENLVEQKIAGVLSSVESEDIDKIGNEYLINHSVFVKLKIRDVKKIEYVELGDFLDQLEWATVVTLIMITGGFLVIVSMAARIILWPLRILIGLWHGYTRNNSREDKNDFTEKIMYGIAHFLTRAILKIISGIWTITEKIKKRLK